MTDEITVAIPAHPARLRNGKLARAVHSVGQQTLPPAALSIAVDLTRAGAPATRQRALDAVMTPWVAMLDSDDFFDPQHLEHLLRHALDTGADYVYSYFHGADFLGHFGKVFDPLNPIETTSTILVRTDLAKSVGYQAIPERLENTGEDRFFTLGCISLGAKIVHLPERTWTYWMDGFNSSGLPTKGDAVS